MIAPGSISSAASHASRALTAPAPPIHPFALLRLTAGDQRRQLTLELELPGAGRLRLSVTAAKQVLALMTRTEGAKTSRVAVVAKLMPAPQGILGARGSETLKVTVSFTPTDGKAQTLIRTITLAPTQK